MVELYIENKTFGIEVKRFYPRNIYGGICNMLDIEPIMTVKELYIIKEKEDKKIRRKEKMKAFVKGLFKLIFMEFVIFTSVVGFFHITRSGKWVYERRK
jgi:hypothetical protein